MSTSFTTAQRTALHATTIQPRLLIDVAGAGGTERYANEPLRWSGLAYEGRILDADPITMALGSPEHGLPALKTFGVTLANADGLFSRRRPGYYAGHTLTVREVLLDVSSDPLRTFTFTIGRVTMPSADLVRFDCEEQLASYRRALVPPDMCLITTTLYPGIREQAGVINQSIPLLFGRTLVPMYLVDESSYAQYVAAIGSAAVPSSGGNVFELFDGQLIPVLTASGTQPWSVQYATRGGIPLTEVYVQKSALAPDGTTPVTRWIDLVGPDASSLGHPDQVLLSLCTHPVYGAGMPATLINSDSLLSARSFYLANSMTFDCALLTQRPLEDWLGDWCHDALTALTTRDTMRLLPQSSAAAQGSFYAGNVVAGTIRYEDAPLHQQETDWTVVYRERTRDVASLSTVTYRATEGVQAVRVSPFIGRRSVAAQVAQQWAQRAAEGIRTYGFSTDLRAGLLEEGDLVTLTQSWAGAIRQSVEIQSLRRRGAVVDMEVREMTPTVYQRANIPADLPSLPSYRSAFVPLDATSRTTDVTITSSHPLRVTPTVLQMQLISPGWYQYVTNSLVSANDSSFTARLTGVANGVSVPIPLAINQGGVLQGWIVRADPQLP